MSAQDSLSQLQFEAHRSLSHNAPIQLKPDLGRHWSVQEDIANELADRQRSGYDHHYSPEYRMTLHAKIPMGSVETKYSELHNRAVLSPRNLNENAEKEVPVKKGSSVFVTGITKTYKAPEFLPYSGKENVDRKIRTRTRTYNPPREMQA
jgi:hypothetical protein